MPSNHPINTSMIPDLPTNSGPLNDYRQLAKFDWKLLRVYLEGEDRLKAKYVIWNRLEKEELFQRTGKTPSVDDQKKLAAMRMKRVVEIGFLPDEIKQASYQTRV
jgi:acyl-CoA oxidase